ncbi:hypothetical protein DPMN_041451 [Dreissena polymorpha]|uniref:Uncharacterized protein n=1 Tax=Dreissena polymorpha TaxID=45954 RepID=A0A9D4CZC6_DREPO|nr:hypothetical protein DPMN_041451 [Dreissena polymorpha]
MVLGGTRLYSLDGERGTRLGVPIQERVNRLPVVWMVKRVARLGVPTQRRE